MLLKERFFILENLECFYEMFFECVFTINKTQIGLIKYIL